MSDGMAITATRLGKSYRLGTRADRPTRATEALVERLRQPLRRERHTTLDALHDVTFEIPWGEAVGIVGRNGAGKSTLLKILTRITAPSTGRVELGGRIGSLLEVGTGFHPELTGRENVYLNGSLLGMRRTEIRRRFDDIVQFAGVASFLETPVKRYSSGMYVRLAFAVAAHLDTEILAIDEVLAVGDTEFQAASLAKMRDVAKDGRTVLYVSHQLHTVSALCTSALYLDHGELQYAGPVDGALARYRDSFASHAVRQLDGERRPGTGEVRAASVELLGDPGDVDAVRRVQIEIPATDDDQGTYFVSSHLVDANGSVLVQCDSRTSGLWLDPGESHRLTLTVGDLWLKPGRYSLDLYLCRAGILDAWEGAASFEVRPDLPYPELVPDEATSAGLVLADFRYERQAR